MDGATQDDEVLAYYAREASGVVETTPLAGLSLPQFRAARGRLLSGGRLVRTTNGRYVPVSA